MIFFVFPIYNEENNIRMVIPRLRELMRGEAYKIVAVNDGSSDGSSNVLAEMTGPDIILEATLINMNIGAVFSLAIDRILFEASSADDIIVIMESDQTSEIDLVKGLISQIRDQGQDIVIASRYEPGGGYRHFPLSRRVFSQCANYFLRWMFPLSPGVMDYTIFMRGYRVGVFHDAVQRFGMRGLIQSQGFIANSELLIKLAFFTKKIKEIPLVYDYGRKIGKSKMNVLRTINEYFVFTRTMKHLIAQMRTRGMLV